MAAAIPFEDIVQVGTGARFFWVDKGTLSVISSTSEEMKADKVLRFEGPCVRFTEQGCVCVVRLAAITSLQLSGENL